MGVGVESGGGKGGGVGVINFSFVSEHQSVDEISIFRMTIPTACFGFILEPDTCSSGTDLVCSSLKKTLSLI